MPKAKRPWQKVHYATGVSEAIELKISHGYQCAAQIATWILMETDGYSRPSEHQVKRLRTQLRKDGYIVYSRKDGWQTHPKWRQ